MNSKVIIIFNPIEREEIQDIYFLILYKNKLKKTQIFFFFFLKNF